jgi:hypothetical protein
MSVLPWDDESGDAFFDPYEARKVPSRDAFFEDPFANTLPNNGWCRVPRCFQPQQFPQQHAQIKAKPNYYLQKSKHPKESTRQPSRMCLPAAIIPTAKASKVKEPAPDPGQEGEPFESVQYKSFYSADSIDEIYDDESLSSLEESMRPQSLRMSPSKTNRSLPTIAEDTAVFAKVPSLAAITIDQDAPLDEYERVAKERANVRVKKWLHKTGLVDEWFVDPKMLPQHRYMSDASVTSKKSQEGIEIGPHGVTLEGNVQHIQISFQQFSAVTVREMDKLDDEILQQQQAMPDRFRDNLKECSPVVRSTVHARLNIGRIFTEVDYFHKIEETCERLHTELAQTGEDWKQVRDICDDHVAMQSFLVELTLEWMTRVESKPGTAKKKVEAVLDPKIKAVRQLGHRLRSKLLSGIEVAFREGENEDLKCLVDAIQLYENEVEELDLLNISSDEAISPLKLRVCRAIMMFGIKRVAIQRILEDADIRSHEVFLDFQEDAADDAGSQTAAKSSFEAVWQASVTMLEAVDIIQEELMPEFPPTWNVFPIWAACVGSVCSQFILQQIGGQEGNNLTLLTPNQLLQLMSFIENFREKVGHDSTTIVLSSKKAEFVTGNDLMRGEMIEAADESLVKVLTVLWHIHRLLEDQFIQSTHGQTNKWLDSVFAADHAKSQTADGRLITSLPEDVWVLARVQLTTIRERFTAEDSSVFFNAACIIFRCMQNKQRISWKASLTDVEMTCAASNDALRMIELAEVELEDIKYDSDFTAHQFEQLDEILEQLSTQFLNDAVHCAKSIHSFIFEPVAETLEGRLFEPEWEDLTHNDMAVTIVRTLEDYLGDLEKWLEESMLRKTLDALVKAFINFYIKQLLLKSIRRHKHTFFNPKRALERIYGDICVLEDYFESWVAKFPALARVLESEFEILYALLELLEIGLGTSDARDPTDFFPFIQKKVGRIDATKFLCCQLWHMISVEGGREMRAMFDDSRDRLVGLGDLPHEALDPSLQLHRNIVEVIEDLRMRLKVKTVAKGVGKSIAKKAGRVKRRASQVIDRIAEA